MFSAAQSRVLLEAARKAIRGALGGLPGEDGAEGAEGAGGIDPVLCQPAGCFVSLHEKRSHRLRGCIGRLDTSNPLLATVQQMARAVLEDPRFEDHRVRLADLPRLELEITVVLPLRAVAHVLDFEPLSDGIYLTIGECGGCFLPQVARETGWGREQLLARLCTEKMGLAAEAWRDPRARLQVFPTYLVGPEGFEGEG